jgi:hypothetical protein
MTKRCGHLSHNPTAPAGTAEPLLGTLQGNPELLQVTLSFIRCHVLVFSFIFVYVRVTSYTSFTYLGHEPPTINK